MKEKMTTTTQSKGRWWPIIPATALAGTGLIVLIVSVVYVFHL